MDDILAISQKLHNLAVTDAKSSEAASTQQQLKTTFTEFDRLMCAHLAEEEVFWPPVLIKYGEKFLDKVAQDVVASGVNAKGVDGEAFKMLFCSAMEALGAPPKASEQVQKQYGPFAMQTEPWCGKKNSDSVYYGIPFFVRWFLRPTWDKRYQTLKATIESVWGDEDVMKIAV